MEWAQRAAIAKFDLKPTFTHSDGGRSADDEQPKGKPDDTTEATTLADDLAAIYLDYIDCLNRQDWTELKQFVDDEVRYNDQLIGLSGYREILERDFSEIPDLHFDVYILICEPPHIASRLRFDCTPQGHFLGLDVNGRKVSFTENVFYRFGGRKIEAVWSVIDKATIEAQLLFCGASPSELIPSAAKITSL